MNWRHLPHASLILALGWAITFTQPNPADGGDPDGSPLGLPTQRAATLGDLRREVDRALVRAFPATPTDRRQQARELLQLYSEVGGAKTVSAVERGRLQSRLRGRLSRLAGALRHDVAQRSLATKQDAEGEKALEAPVSTQPAQARGGAPQDDGQELVELIQATIAPQSWDVNGGQGTIMYWPAWHVLVVRQTDDVHEQIGGVVHDMRR